MRLFIIILIGVLLLLQLPETQKYIDKYFKEVEVYVKRLLDIDSTPSVSKPKTIQNSSAVPSTPRRVETTSDLPIQDNSPKSFNTNYKGQDSTFSGSRGSY